MHFITIARHGETISNAADTVQSRTGGELTARGVLMAQSLGRRLQNETLTQIYSSDLNRCQQTTTHLVAQLKTKVPPIVYTPTLRERDYGDWEHEPTQVVRDKMAVMGLRPCDRHMVEVPNGESFEDCRERGGQFFCQLLQQLDGDDDGGNVLAVSHGIFIVCLFQYLRDNPGLYQLVNLNGEDFKERALNTSISRCCVEKIDGGPQWRLTFTHLYDADHVKFL